MALQRSPFSWPPSPGFEFSLTAWNEHYVHLGGAAPDDVWNTTALPYSSFEYTNLLHTVNENIAETMLEQAEAAVKSLEQWSASVPLHP